MPDLHLLVISYCIVPSQSSSKVLSEEVSVSGLGEHPAYPFLQQHCQNPTESSPRSWQWTHLSCSIRTRPARNPTSALPILFPSKLQYDFFALGLANSWFLAALRSPFSHCSLSNPLGFLLIFAFNCYLSNEPVSLLLSSVRSPFKSASQKIQEAEHTLQTSSKERKASAILGAVEKDGQVFMH